MRKKLWIVFSFLILSVPLVHAQEYQKFRVGVGVGYCTSTGYQASGGGFVDIEPGYRVADRALLNFRYELAGILRSSASISDFKLEFATISSYTLNGQYYLSDKNPRLYIGGGFGIFSISGLNLGSGRIPQMNSFGFYPRVGLDAGHFNLNIDFNIIPNEGKVTGTDETVNNSYICFRIGGYFGGGKKQK
jgi:hypothetical protein